MMMDSVAERLVKVVPTQRQLEWQRNEFTAFLHFGMNTFTGREWGDGTHSPELFNPTALDTDQWCEALKAAEVRACILTAKHHDGFCLWDTKKTDYNVMRSPFGLDVVKLFSESCKKFGLKLGLYLSPWDRHEQTYGEGQAYNDYFCAQLEELLTGYGELYCMWFDGACGEGPNGKRQVYDWDRYYELIRKHQPMAAISVCGPDVRWCGNEAGQCRAAEWSVVPSRLRSAEKVHADSQQRDSAAFRERPIKSEDQDLGSRALVKEEPELIWYPAEVDVSIRPGWFYHVEEDRKVKSLDKLMDIYVKSVGGNAVLLLNVPPDTRGLIHEMDARRLGEMGAAIRSLSENDITDSASIETSSSAPGHEARLALSENEEFWMAEDEESATITLRLETPKCINRMILMEQVLMSQRIESFSIRASLGGSEEKTVFEGETVGYKKICQFAPTEADCLKLVIHESRLSPTLKFLGAYEVPAKEASR